MIVGISLFVRVPRPPTHMPAFECELGHEGQARARLRRYFLEGGVSVHSVPQQEAPDLLSRCAAGSRRPVCPEAAGPHPLSAQGLEGPVRWPSFACLPGPAGPGPVEDADPAVPVRQLPAAPAGEQLGVHPHPAGRPLGHKDAVSFRAAREPCATRLCPVTRAVPVRAPPGGAGRCTSRPHVPTESRHACPLAAGAGPFRIVLRGSGPAVSVPLGMFPRASLGQRADPGPVLVCGSQCPGVPFRTRQGCAPLACHPTPARRAGPACGDGWPAPRGSGLGGECCCCCLQGLRAGGPAP